MYGYFFEDLKTEYEGISVYNAGLPHYDRNFARDSLLSGILLKDLEILRGQLELCKLLQGKVNDPDSGEEPGKIFHEYPPVRMNERSTMYSACDTTALYLIAGEIYLADANDPEFLNEFKDSFLDAVAYIMRHISKDGLFYEDPLYVRDVRYALDVTYWKDSHMPGDRRSPSYPVTYSLAQFINARGLLSAAWILDMTNLIQLSVHAKKAGLNHLWCSDTGFLVGIDMKGPIKGPSSDTLHILNYLDMEDLEDERLEVVLNVAEALETNMGYMATLREVALRMEDRYHGDVVWPFEQAFIHRGACKFGLSSIKRGSSQVYKYLATAPEFITSVGELKGCDPQLWTLAAKSYFRDVFSRKKSA